MRKVAFSIFLLLSAMCLQAQRTNVTHLDPMRMGYAGDVLFEGDIKNVPDGTLVNFWIPYDDEQFGEVVDTIAGGKFSFKKRINKSGIYFITLDNGKGECPIQTNYDVTVRITGDGSDCSSWKVVIDDPIKEEFDAFAAFREKEVNADYFDELYKFMKNRQYTAFYDWELDQMVPANEKDMAKKRELYLKVPFEKVDDNALRLFVPANIEEGEEFLNVGDDMIDFTLYDSNGKQHHLAEFKGNGRYLLLEICCKDFGKLMKTRPTDKLKDLYRKYSNKLDIVTVNCDMKDVWKSGKYPRDQWNEWNDYNNGLPIIARYTNQFNYVFISPEGKILGFGKHDNLMDKAKQHFAFVK